MVRRSAEEIAQIERLQRRGKRHHDLQNKPNGDQLLEAVSHESLEGPEYKLGTEAALAVATQRIVKFARVMFVFYGTLSCVGTTWLHDIHVVHTWSHDKNALSASLENLEFATQPRPRHTSLKQKCSIHRSRFVFVRTRKMVDAGRLFSCFPLVEQLDITVRHPISHASILSGTAHRADFLAVPRLSIPMRLKMLGLAYESGRGGLRPLAL